MMSCASSTNVAAPSILLMNVRSLRNKTDELHAVSSVLCTDIIAITESWLNDDTPDNEVKIPHYCTPFRQDRHDRLGGGVCCYVHKDTSCSQLEMLTQKPPSIECLWLKFPKFKIVLAVLYIPPSLSSIQYSEIRDYIIVSADIAMDSVQDGRLILLGDFNRMDTRDLESSLDVEQIVREATRGEATLDLIFLDSDMKDRYHDPVIGPHLGSSDHMSVLLRPLTMVSRTVSVHKVVDYRKSSLDLIWHNISQLPWHKWYRSDLSVSMINELYYGEILSYFIDYSKNCSSLKTWS